MKRVGSYEAKTHLPRLLAEVEAGETVVITRHGVDIAKLVQANADDRASTAEVIARMKARRALTQPLSIKEILTARNEGRKPVE